MKSKVLDKPYNLEGKVQKTNDLDEKEDIYKQIDLEFALNY